MTITLRIILILCSLVTFVYAIRKIRAARIDIGDTFFWIVFAFCLLLLSVFPFIMDWLARICGVESPVNMVFLLVIAALTYKCFTLTIKVSMLEIKLKTLTGAIAVDKTLRLETEAGTAQSGKEQDA